MISQDFKKAYPIFRIFFLNMQVLCMGYNYFKARVYDMRHYLGMHNISWGWSYSEEFFKSVGSAHRPGLHNTSQAHLDFILTSSKTSIKF